MARRLLNCTSMAYTGYYDVNIPDDDIVIYVPGHVAARRRAMRMRMTIISIALAVIFIALAFWPAGVTVSFKPTYNPSGISCQGFMREYGFSSYGVLWNCNLTNSKDYSATGGAAFGCPLLFVPLKIHSVISDERVASAKPRFNMTHGSGASNVLTVSNGY